MLCCLLVCPPYLSYLYQESAANQNWRSHFVSCSGVIIMVELQQNEILPEAG